MGGGRGNIPCRRTAPSASATPSPSGAGSPQASSAILLQKKTKNGDAFKRRHFFEFSFREDGRAGQVHRGGDAIRGSDIDATPIPAALMHHTDMRAHDTQPVVPVVTLRRCAWEPSRPSPSFARPHTVTSPATLDRVHCSACQHHAHARSHARSANLPRPANPHTAPFRSSLLTFSPLSPR